jgi:hypothetical protein
MTTRTAAPIILDVWGTDLAIWIPSYSGIGGGNGPGIQMQNPLPAGADLVINGDFENGLARWQNTNAGVPASLVTASTDTYAGANSLLIDSVGAAGLSTSVVQIGIGNPKPGGPNQALVRVIPGASIVGYGVGKWNANAGGIAGIGVDYFDADGNLLSSGTIVSWSTETVYTGKTGTLTVPDGVSYAAFSVVFTSALGATKFWIDEVHVTSQGASLTGTSAVVSRVPTL